MFVLFAVGNPDSVASMPFSFFCACSRLFLALAPIIALYSALLTLRISCGCCEDMPTTEINGAHMKILIHLLARESTDSKLNGGFSDGSCELKMYSHAVRVDVVCKQHVIITK